MLRRLIAPTLFLAFVLQLPAQADTNMPGTSASSPFTFGQSASPSLSWGGSLTTDDRLKLYQGDYEISFQEYRLNLQPKYSSNRMQLHSEIWIRTFQFPRVSSFHELDDKRKLVPVELDLREAYMDVYDFLIPGLDLRVGRQRVAWGTADGINPTDNLNPYDLEDIWDFGRHLASNGLKLTWYKEAYTMSGIWIPHFSPSLAPASVGMQALSPSLSLPTRFEFAGMPWQLSLTKLNDSLFLPSHRLSESGVYGFKLQRDIASFTTSISYARSRDPIPVPFQARAVPHDIQGDTLRYTLDVALRYPRVHVLGLDLAGSFKKVGVWGEFALFFPEQVDLKAMISVLNTDLPLFDSTMIEDKPYLRWVVGMDYTFINDVYVNVQYLRGFIHERGRDELGHYLFFHADYTGARGRLKLSPLDFCLHMEEFQDIKNSYALVLLPAVTYKPVDNMEIRLGLRWIEGSPGTLFGKMKDQSHLYLRVSAMF